MVPSTKHRELQSSIPVAIGDIRRAGLNAVRLAVLAELVEAHSPFDRLRENALNRTVLEMIVTLQTQVIQTREQVRAFAAGASPLSFTLADRESAHV